MKVCLIPPKIEIRNPAENLQRFQARLAEVAPYQPDLVCLPECAFTGYLYEHEDFEKFAEPIPGETTDVVSKLAKECECYICFGMTEKAQEDVYGSAVLIDKAGQLIHVHRKISEHPPFATGNEVEPINTEFGNISVLLCGDLFDDGVKASVSRDTNILILPLARSFDGKSPDLERWLKEERQAYADEVRKVGVTGLIVNSLEDSALPEASFGGAMIVSPDGEVLAESEHGTDKALIFEMGSVMAKGG
ncbi:carbon-nitrogen hydrolase family protein [Roseiflexus castenholzii]|uniref:carbon-nitrogen hydrolase family protein n=1 Tax=Roseiflexus castenholzii TaxID=120962 RepID=UPI003C7EA369